ncbi:hypothetical protein ABFV05_019264 [Capra hircus]
MPTFQVESYTEGKQHSWEGQLLLLSLISCLPERGQRAEKENQFLVLGTDKIRQQRFLEKYQLKETWHRLPHSVSPLRSSAPSARTRSQTLPPFGHAAHKHYSIMQVAEHYREHLLMQMKSIWKKKQENQRNIKKVTNTFRAWEGFINLRLVMIRAEYPKVCQYLQEEKQKHLEMLAIEGAVIFQRLNRNVARMIHTGKLLRKIYEELKEMCLKADVDMLQGVEDTMKRSQLMQLYIPQPLDPQLSTWTITGMLERLNSFRVYITLDGKIRNCCVPLIEALRRLQCGPVHRDVPWDPARPENTPTWGAQTFTAGKHYWEITSAWTTQENCMDAVIVAKHGVAHCKTSELTHLLNLESDEAEDSAEVSELLGPFKCPQNLEMAMPESQEDWSKEDIVQLLEKMRPQYLQKHPKMSNKELTKVLSEEYRKLPEQLKLKYSQDFQKEKQEFQEKMALFGEQHPDLVRNSKKPDVPKRSQSKVPKKFQENVQKVKSPPENHLPMKSKFHGEPEKPPMNAYHKFHQDLWSSRELKVVPPRERMVEISRRWQRVPQDQKELYKKQAEELQTQYKVDLDLWLRTLSPEEYAAYREATCAKRRSEENEDDAEDATNSSDHHSAQLCTLLGLACVSANVMDSAEVQFTTALRLTNDWELWAFIVTNLVFLTLQELPEIGFSDSGHQSLQKKIGFEVCLF